MKKNLLEVILKDKGLSAAVPYLPAQVLKKMINHVGLEDASELISLASVEQLKKVFDEDLWLSMKPGQTEQFDADRFHTWLEVMTELGDKFVTEKLQEMDEDFLVMAFSELVFVINMEQLDGKINQKRTDGQLLEKALDSSATFEVDEYVIIAKKIEGWSVLSEICLILDKEDRSLLVRILDQCMQISTEQIDDGGGLYSVLTQSEKVNQDIQQQRDDRRSAEGFISPTEALAFFSLIRVTVDNNVIATQSDPIVRLYFQKMTEAQIDSIKKDFTIGSDITANDGTKDNLDLLVQYLKATEIIQDEVLLLKTKELTAEAQTAAKIYHMAMLKIAIGDEVWLDLQNQELAFLGNSLLAGCAIQKRKFRLPEVAEAITSTCLLGINKYFKKESIGTLENLSQQQLIELKKKGSIHLFKLGFLCLTQDLAQDSLRLLSVFVQQKLSEFKPKNEKQLVEIKNNLSMAIKQNKSWLAHAKIKWLKGLLGPEIISKLEMATDEFPHLLKLADEKAGLEQIKFCQSLNDIQLYVEELQKKLTGQ